VRRQCPDDAGKVAPAPVVPADCLVHARTPAMTCCATVDRCLPGPTSGPVTHCNSIAAHPLSTQWASICNNNNNVQWVCCSARPSICAICTLDELQSLQNTAARLVTRARKFDLITPVMRELHWLPVRQRIRFKTAVLVFKCLHGLAAEYLSEYRKLTTGRSHLRSTNACLLSVPRTRTTYGDRSFAVSGPVSSNSLPVALCSSDVTEETFRRHLKTFLFNCLDN